MTNENNPIPLITPDNSAAHSGDVVGENVATLKALFPQIVTDGKVDFDVLRQLLGDAVEEGEERYGLNWKGKAKARAHALTPTLATLRPAKNDSTEWDNTQNIFIEGDNLEALKTLRKAYAGRVKLIYIDPPYNTGKDFVYPDNYTDSLSNYLQITGQRGNNGLQLTSNKEASGRFHTDWLNMMYPRLMLAKDFLLPGGVIFISIGKAELENVIQLCSQIFGKENHIANLCWKARVKPVNIGEAKYRPQDENEYVVVFQNGYQGGVFQPLYTGGERSYNHDLDGRRYRLQTILKSNRGANRRDTMCFALGEYTPPEGQRWQAGEDEIKSLFADGYIEFRGETPFRRYFEDEEGAEHDPFYSFVEVESSGTSEAGKLVVNELMGENHGFDTVKPMKIMKTIIQSCTKDNDLILDFFAGSGTTGHATMAQNAEDGGQRRFILVQLPEALDPAKSEQRTSAQFCDKLSKPRNIAELTKERLRRAGTKVKRDHPAVEVDTGFRVYRLDSSNLKPWQPDPENLEASLLDAVSNIMHGRSEEDLLVELLLKTGIDLTTPAEVRQIAGRDVYALGGGALIVCLADISDEDAEALGHGLADWQAELDPAGQTTFYFKDTGFASASAKANVAAILRQRLGDKIAKLASI